MKESDKRSNDTSTTRSGDEGRPIGDPLDKATPHFPEDGEAVSCSPASNEAADGMEQQRDSNKTD